MKLTTAEGYALRAMVFLAKRCQEGNAFSLSEIAEQEQLPLSFLEQIFIGLKKAKLVKSVRGAHGGYTLANQPKDINTLKVIEAVSGKSSMIDCNRDFCSAGNCAVAPFLTKLQLTIEKTLRDTTLADLTN
ncbi:MAG TPA: Rrf2 family transcriptional regulator [bacterium]|nr:Rrf2 family transcriptional regulator [bacterium]